MWRPVLALAALAALTLPAAAGAAPPPPEPSAPALAGPPQLVRTGPERLTLYLRLDRPVARRFDGELLATAIVDRRFSSLTALRGRRVRRSACYSASVAPVRTDVGRVATTVLLVDGAEPVTTLLAVRAPRRGDDRGAPLGC
jgi:hypothetical protein